MFHGLVGINIFRFDLIFMSNSANFCCCQLLLLPTSAVASFCCCQLLMLPAFDAIRSVALFCRCKRVSAAAL